MRSLSHPRGDCKIQTAANRGLKAASCSVGNMGIAPPRLVITAPTISSPVPVPPLSRRVVKEASKIHSRFGDRIAVMLLTVILMD